MSIRPNTLNGMRHMDFTVENLDAVERPYVELLGMQVLHRPHRNLVYLTLGNDNLSLSRGSANDTVQGPQRLDHFGFICDEPGDVDAWADYLARQGVDIIARPPRSR